MFNSGVKVWKHYLRKAQRERFAVKNLWEQLDEPLITKVLQHAQKGDLFIDCGVYLARMARNGRSMGRFWWREGTVVDCG